MAKARVAFFLEDAAQEAVIPPLFERLAIEESYTENDFDLQVLSARGGGSVHAVRDFVKQAKKNRILAADLLIVGADANCKGFTKRRQQVQDATRASTYPQVITAIPDPHVERWYMLDFAALSKAAGVSLSASPATYKCDKNRYKTLLRDVFTNSGVTPPLGGIEYGPAVAQQIDLFRAGKEDHGFDDFVKTTQAWLRQLKN